MGFITSLQRSLHADFSERVLLLHGLSSWPSSHGSYVVCEVDLSGEGGPNGSEEVKFVIEAIPRASSGEKGTNLRDSGRVDTIERDQIKSPREVQSLQVEDGLLAGGVNQKLENGTAGRTEVMLGLPSHQRSSNHPEFLQAEAGTPVGKMEVHSVLTELAILAPYISVCPASYETLVPIVRELQGRNVGDNKSHKKLNTADLSLGSPEPEAQHRGLNFEIDGSESTLFGRARHPNLAPILGILQGDLYIYVIYPLMSFSIQSLLYFSPGALGDDQHTRFLIFQILSAVAYTHDQGLTHGDLRPSNVLLTDDLWCLVTGYLRSSQRKISKLVSHDRQSINLTLCDSDVGLASSSDLNPEASIGGFHSDWRIVIKRWWAGEISNYDYLLLLNKLAGRQWADPCFHSVMPWVIDFSVRPHLQLDAGWRDLSKSKWRLAKGDEQLDFTYASAEMPHHVSDECLSELAVCIYKARRLPLLVLRRIVRSVYEPNEYPVNMQRLYQWTPDECIPEFYSDAQIFESIHPGMNNLAVPTWAEDAKEFTALHRAALESDRVSSQLHQWIDLTFGYKLSGEAAVNAKNVTLSTVGPNVPRSSGRRQLFSKPHPRRQPCKTTDVLEKTGEYLPPKLAGQKALHQTQVLRTAPSVSVLSLQRASTGLPLKNKFDTLHSGSFSSLELLEEVTHFYESARHLSPCYKLPAPITEKGDMVGGQNHERNSAGSFKVTLETWEGRWSSYNLDTFISILDDTGQYRKLVERLHEDGDDEDDLYESLWASRKNVGHGTQLSVGQSEDIFALGCVIAELYLRRPLFNPTTASAYRAHGTLPDLMESLPPIVQWLVKSTLQNEFARRPTISELLDSSFFSSTIRAAYFFLAPIQLLTSRRDRLQYLARMARGGTFVAMGHSAAEMCTPSCVSFLVPPYQDIDVEAVVLVLTKLLQALKPFVCKRLVVPVVQRLLQSQQSPLLNMGLLQVSFIKQLWSVVGTGAYLQSVHVHVLGSLRRASSSDVAMAASKVLVSMCLDLGVPITLYQTVLPLLQAFGRDITSDHIDVLIGIGERMGEKLVVKHLVPPLRTIIQSNLELLITEGPGPVHSWRLLAMVDAMAVLERLRSILRPGIVFRELLQEPQNVYLKVLLQMKSSPNLLQCAAKALLLVCNHVGAEATVSVVLPQLKQLFDGLVFAGKLDSGPENGKSSFKSSRKGFSQSAQASAQMENSASAGIEEKQQLFFTSGFRSGGSNVMPLSEAKKGGDDIVLVHILYSGLASLLGIERLRQGLPTWLLLEQALLKHVNWKWTGSDLNQSKAPESKSADLSYESVNPANLLLDGVGWSSPLSQGSKWNKSPSSRRLSDLSSEKFKVSDFDIGEDEEAWSWVSSKDALWDAEAFGRVGAFGLAKDAHAWGLSCTVLHSWKAHPASIRSIAVSEDENTIFTAGGGPKGGSVVREWRLGTRDCLMEYAGHDETVNDVCILPGNENLASCDGTIHVWSAQTGLRVALFDESSNASSSSSSSPRSSGLSTFNISSGESSKSSLNLANGNGGMSNQTLTPTGLYSCMHSMEAEERLVAGMANGSLRFIDINRGQQLYAWRLSLTETSLSSFVSAISSSGQGESMEGRKYSLRSSWVAVGFGSGLCRLIDYNSGSIIGKWRAHDGFITKLYALEERYLVSSSLDKTVSIWDLRRSSSPERLQVFRGHKRGVSSFALKGCDLLSAAGSKIGLSCLSTTTLQGEEKQVIQPQRLYSAERASRSLSNISTISVLPYSRLFIIGTDDGHVKICS